MPEKPEHVKEELKKFSKSKLPYFFKYAKDKEDSQTAEVNNSTVNKLNSIIPNKPIQFKKVAGKCDYKLMMNNNYPNHNKIKNEKLINRFVEINRIKKLIIYKDGFDDLGFNEYLKSELLKIYKSESYIVDVLVENFFSKDSKAKDTLWNCYGNYIYENLKFNLGNSFCCINCNKREERNSARQIYCKSCAIEIEKEKNKKRVSKHRKG